MTEIREHDDLDNYFIALSDLSFLRINTSDFQGRIQEELAHHEYDATSGAYSASIKKWFEEANSLEEQGGIWK